MLFIKPDGIIPGKISCRPDPREQFVIYSYYELKDETVFVYLPLFTSRLIAIVQCPKEQSASPTLEMYDLNNSSAIMEAVAKMKGDGK